MKHHLTEQGKEIFAKWGLSIDEPTPSLLLTGTPGVGKTYILREYAKKHNVEILTEPMLLSGYKKSGIDYLMEIVQQPVLLVDDLLNTDAKIWGENINIIEQLIKMRCDHIESCSEHLKKVLNEIEFLNKEFSNPNRPFAGYRDNEEFKCAMTSRENARENWLKSIKFITIITSNIKMEEFSNILSARAIDRLKTHLKPIQVTEESHRETIILRYS